MKPRVTRRAFLRVGGAGIAGAALFGAAGCGGGVGDQSGKVTLTWWDYWTTGATNTVIQDALSRYVEANPGVRIERRSIPFARIKPTLLMAARKLPDIAIIDNLDYGPFSNLGALQNVSDLVERWGEADAYYDGPWRFCHFDGASYGVLNTSNCLALFYNKDLLESARQERQL